MLFGFSIGAIDPTISVIMSIVMALGGWWYRGFAKPQTGATPAKSGELGDLIRAAMREMLPNVVDAQVLKATDVAAAPADATKGPFRDLIARTADLWHKAQGDLQKLEEANGSGTPDATLVQSAANQLVALAPLIEVILRANGVPIKPLAVSPVQIVKVAAGVNLFDGISPDEAKKIVDLLRTLAAARTAAQSADLATTPGQPS